MSGTSSGLGSSNGGSAPASTEPAASRQVDDDDNNVVDVDDVDDNEQQTEKLVSACDDAVQRLSSPTGDSDSIELDSLTRRPGQSPPPDSVEHPSSPRR